jgi:hypothetical protein
MAAFDFLWLCTALGIGAACVISFAFGWLLGGDAVRKSRRPILPSDDEAAGDWPHCSDLVVHGGERSDVRA